MDSSKINQTLWLLKHNFRTAVRNPESYPHMNPSGSRLQGTHDALPCASPSRIPSGADVLPSPCVSSGVMHRTSCSSRKGEGRLRLTVVSTCCRTSLSCSSPPCCGWGTDRLSPGSRSGRGESSRKPSFLSAFS